MKVSTEIDNNFGDEKITQLVDNIPLNVKFQFIYWHTNHDAHSTNQLSFNIILYHTILGTPVSSTTISITL